MPCDAAEHAAQCPMLDPLIRHAAAAVMVERDHAIDIGIRLQDLGIKVPLDGSGYSRRAVDGRDDGDVVASADLPRSAHIAFEGFAFDGFGGCRRLRSQIGVVQRVFATQVVVVDMIAAADGMARDSDRPTVLEDFLSGLDVGDRQFVSCGNILPGNQGRGAIVDVDGLTSSDASESHNAMIVGAESNPRLVLHE